MQPREGGNGQDEQEEVGDGAKGGLGDVDGGPVDAFGVGEEARVPRGGDGVAGEEHGEPDGDEAAGADDARQPDRVAVPGGGREAVVEEAEDDLGEDGGGDVEERRGGEDLEVSV